MKYDIVWLLSCCLDHYISNKSYRDQEQDADIHALNGHDWDCPTCRSNTRSLVRICIGYE